MRPVPSSTRGRTDLLSGVTQAYQGLLGTQRIQATLQVQINLLEQVMKLKPIPEVRIGLVEARQGLLQVPRPGRGVDATTQWLARPAGLHRAGVGGPRTGGTAGTLHEDAAQAALANSPEVREASQTIAKAQAALQVARMDYLPDIAVISGYANQTAASYIQPNIGYLGITGSYTFGIGANVATFRSGATPRSPWHSKTSK